jgi:hypothetical protein
VVLLARNNKGVVTHDSSFSYINAGKLADWTAQQDLVEYQADVHHTQTCSQLRVSLLAVRRSTVLIGFPATILEMSGCYRCKSVVRGLRSPSKGGGVPPSKLCSHEVSPSATGLSTRSSIHKPRYPLHGRRITAGIGFNFGEEDTGMSGTQKSKPRVCS